MSLSHIVMNDVFNQYELRLAAHQELIGYFQANDIHRYVELAVGITRLEGNYSASEHNLGVQILHENTEQAVFALATQLNALQNPHHIPDNIYRANLPYLRISVGSEIGMMLRPNDFWVGNVRTIWSHLLLRHNFNYAIANEELELYREPNGRRPSEMEYRIWRDLYLAIESNLRVLADMGRQEAVKQGARHGTHLFMWSDAICSALYANA